MKRTRASSVDPAWLDRARLLDRARGAYLGVALGDALGASAEFMTATEIRASYGVLADLVGGGWLRLKPGQVTDDTTMTLALGAAILKTGGVDADCVAVHFSDWMRGKPIDIGHTVRRGIVHFRNGGGTCVPYDEDGAGNGACMRCLPVAIAGLGRDDDLVRDWVLTQAHLTHNNELSDAATLVVVRLIQHGLLGAPRSVLLRVLEGFAEANPVFDHRRGKRLVNPGGFVVETLRAVFQALVDHADPAACVIDVVNRGGDADTTGAIAGAICGAFHGADAWPRRWLRRLDPAIARDCTEQAERLLDLALAAHGHAGTDDARA